MKVNSIDKEIKKLLASDYFRIPRFQRPYSWERENVQEFLIDIISDTSSDEDYFIGSMVVFKYKDDYLGVVDGQQRLTTITMIICALRDVFKEEGFEHLAMGAQTLIEKTNEDNVKQFVLNTESSFPFFQERILKYDEPSINIQIGKEEENVQNAYELILKFIRDMIKTIRENPAIGEERKKKEIENQLISIREKILKLKLIYVELDDEDDAYVIFETLNTRGKELSVSDLLRNFFTKNLRPNSKDIDTTKLQWEKVLKTIGDSSFDINVDNFVHHYWLSKYGYVTLKKLFKTIKSVIKGQKTIKEFLDALVTNAKIYREIHETDYRKWNPPEQSVKGSLRALQIFRVRQQTPLVLSVIREYENHILKISHVKNILSAVENFHFIFTAVTSQRSSGGISQMYVSHATKLEGSQSLEEKFRVLRELKDKLRQRIPTFEEFNADFKEILYTTSITKQKALLKYILSKYDSHFRKDVNVDYESLTIEHIAPQNPKTNPLTEEIYGMIGNQILVKEELNIKLSNKPFKEKIRILRESKCFLDDMLSSVNEMDGDAIIKRTEHIAKIAYEEIWKI